MTESKFDLFIHSIILEQNIFRKRHPSPKNITTFAPVMWINLCWLQPRKKMLKRTVFILLFDQLFHNF